jgi:transposase
MEHLPFEEMSMTFNDDTRGSDEHSHRAAQSPDSNLVGVPHNAKSPLPENVVLGPQRVNRRWAPQEKARITAESFEPGANVTAVARRHGVSIGLLHYWRRTARDRGAFDPVSIIPLAVEEIGSVPCSTSNFEIEIGGARIHVRGLVDGTVLRAVFDALRDR